jgi:Crinkler effector protein N-terminal domain
MPAQENEYYLWCCLSDNPLPVLYAIVSKDATVAELKQKIWKEVQPILDGYAAHQLELWKADIPMNDLRSNTYIAQEPALIPGCCMLDEVTRLSQVFKVPPVPGNLHIIIKSPDGELHNIKFA